MLDGANSFTNIPRIVSLECHDKIAISWQDCSIAPRRVLEINWRYSLDKNSKALSYYVEVVAMEMDWMIAIEK